MMFAILVLGNIGIHKVMASTGCVVKQTSSPWTVDPDSQTITGTFIVTGGLGCQEEVSVMSWNADTSKLPGDAFWSTQTVNDVQTQTLGAGTHSITVKLPECSGYQADVIAGGNPSSTLKPPGQGSYYDGKQQDGSGIVVASAVGDHNCQTSKSTPTSAATTTDKTDKPKPISTTPITTLTPTIPLPAHTFTPVITVISSTPSGTPILLASSIKPTTLPNTGPGTTVGLFVLVSIAAGLIHHGYHRRKHHRAVLAGEFYNPVIHHPQHHIPRHQEQPINHTNHQEHYPVQEHQQHPQPEHLQGHAIHHVNHPQHHQAQPHAQHEQYQHDDQHPHLSNHQ